MREASRIYSVVFFSLWDLNFHSVLTQESYIISISLLHILTRLTRGSIVFVLYKMSLQSTTFKKRVSQTRKARNQQRCRRRKGLFKKPYEYGLECDVDVLIVLQIRKDGKMFTFDTDSSRKWLPSIKEESIDSAMIIDWSMSLTHY